MQKEKITIEVPAKTAEAYRNASPEQREKAERAVTLALQSPEEAADELEQPSTEEEGHYWLGGRKPTREEAAAAAEQIEALRKGNRLGDDLTLRDLIEEGRR